MSCEESWFTEAQPFNASFENKHLTVVSVTVKSVVSVILSGWSWLLGTLSGVAPEDLLDAMRANSFFIQSQGLLPGRIGLLD